MILDELVMHDFGVYGGRQEVPLTPRDPARPVILFGGMNGGGKTTLLDAVQLCLYGSAAKTSNRGGLSYPAYLDRCIHRAAGTSDAGIELAFSQNARGCLHRFRLRRSWTRSASGARERLELLRDGEPDDLAAEHWSEQVERFMPARIANLFLFDGEKIEGYADFERTSALIGTAIQNLLGLDIVDQLVGDLKTIERRRRTAEKPDADDDALRTLGTELATAQRAHEAAVQTAGGLTNEADRARLALETAEADFRRRGGALYERRGQIEGEAEDAEREVHALRVRLREVAAGALPMVMVVDLLFAVSASDEAERRHLRDALTREAVRIEHEAFRDILSRIAPDALGPVEMALSSRLPPPGDGSEAARPGPVLGDDARGQLDDLLRGGLDVETNRAAAIGADLAAAKRRQRRAREELADIPSEDAIAELLAARTRAREVAAEAVARAATADASVTQGAQRIAYLRERETALLDKLARRRFERQDTQRVTEHSRRVRATLGAFREAVVARHVGDIEHQILDCFRRLVGKGDLVSGVRIDPITFALDLQGPRGSSLTPERLSAGERQLLAVSILWGLARASGRPLPTVIDTPLGRLDSVHRRNLVQRYFPVASHQVLLLSTDREIVSRDLDDLRPHVDRVYRLVHAPGTDATSIEPGYFGATA